MDVKEFIHSNFHEETDIVLSPNIGTEILDALAKALIVSLAEDRVIMLKFNDSYYVVDGTKAVDEVRKQNNI